MENFRENIVKLRTITIIVLISMNFNGICLAENAKKYTDMVKVFYNKTYKCNHVKISDFNELFGEGNEAELEMILIRKFDIISGDEYLNKDIVDKVNKILSSPSKYDSEFLKLLCVSKELNVDKIENNIVYPIQKERDYVYVYVYQGLSKITFEFSRGESYIENIYLPNGKSVYSLIKESVN